MRRARMMASQPDKGKAKAAELKRLAEEAAAKEAAEKAASEAAAKEAAEKAASEAAAKEAAKASKAK